VRSPSILTPPLLVVVEDRLAFADGLLLRQALVLGAREVLQLVFAHFHVGLLPIALLSELHAHEALLGL
jgi:hypothetical protein